jgi:ribosome-associated protein
METGFQAQGDGQSAVSIGGGRTVDASKLSFSFVRSSGPGGQNVNKRATKAQMRVRVEDLGLPFGAARRLRKNAGSLMTQDDELLITCDDTRSQSRNKQGCIDQLRAMVNLAMVIPKTRKKTKPTRGSVERRIGEKKRRGEIKRRRSSRGED